jgi:hypothetical protein
MGKTSLCVSRHLAGSEPEAYGQIFAAVHLVPLQAYNAFTPDQRKAILRHVASIVHAPIDTLERVGGGGVRCTLAELF